MTAFHTATALNGECIIIRTSARAAKVLARAKVSQPANVTMSMRLLDTLEAACTRFINESSMTRARILTRWPAFQARLLALGTDGELGHDQQVVDQASVSLETNVLVEMLEAATRWASIDSAALDALFDEGIAQLPPGRIKRLFEKPEQRPLSAFRDEAAWGQGQALGRLPVSEMAARMAAPLGRLPLFRAAVGQGTGPGQGARNGPFPSIGLWPPPSGDASSSESRTRPPVAPPPARLKRPRPQPGPESTVDILSLD
jgi:hypothetical protein